MQKGISVDFLTSQFGFSSIHHMKPMNFAIWPILQIDVSRISNSSASVQKEDFMRLWYNGSEVVVKRLKTMMKEMGYFEVNIYIYVK